MTCRRLPNIVGLLLCLVAVPSSGGAQTASSGRIAFFYACESGDNGICLAAINPDGTNRFDLIDRATYLQRVASGYGGGDWLAWSPDGLEIAFTAVLGDQLGLYTVPATGGALKYLADNGRNPSWSPDGSHIAYSAITPAGDTNIHVVPSAGGAVVALTSGGANTLPQWAPDGRQISFVGNGELYVMNADGTGVTRIAPGVTVVGPGRWSADSSRLAFTCPSAYRTDICVVGRDGSGLVAATVGGGWDFSWNFEPAWSPDQARLAFVTQYGVYGIGGGPALDIATVNADGSSFVDVGILTGAGSLSTDHPDWSPDGSRITFTSIWPSSFDNSASARVAVMNADGTGWTQIASGWSPAWRPGRPAGAPPTVAIASPATGSAFTAPATITLAASASDSDGTIISVEFYRGASLVATDYAAPYSVTLSGLGAAVRGPQTYTFTAIATDNAGLRTISGSVTVTVNPSGSLPFNGTPVSLPGTIQAENFDEGGEAVAYVDTSTGNSGGQYRATDVDIEATSDVGGGYNVGWMAAGELLTYTVNVVAAGTYALVARVASNGPGGTFHLELDNAPMTGELTVPNTGGWQQWSDLTAVVTLPAGTHVIRVWLDAIGASGAVGNLNYLRFSASRPGSTPFLGTAASLPGTIQAETFDEGGETVAYVDTSAGNGGGQYRATDVDIEATTDVGGGYNVGWMAAGEWLAYTVDIAAAGPYTLVARVACNGPGGTFHLELDDAAITGPLTVPDTGGWQQWTDVTTMVTLLAGTHVVRVALDTIGGSGTVGNLNYLRFSAPGAGSTPFLGTAATIPGIVQAENFDEGGLTVAYVDLSAGNSGGQYRATDVDIEATTDVGGGYNAGWMTDAEWLSYTVNIAASGPYTLVARVACNGPGGTFHLELDHTPITGPLTVPNTRGWQQWTDVTTTVTLPAGTHVIRVALDTIGGSGAVGNLNYLQFK